MLPDYQLIDGVATGCVEQFNEAVSRGANVNAISFEGQSALEVAIRGDYPEIARRLIRLGADPNGAIGKRGDKLIHLAVRLGSIGMLAVLLEQGANPNAPGYKGQTALHQAERQGYGFMAKLLIDAGAVPEIKDANHETPKMLAARLDSDCRQNVPANP